MAGYTSATCYAISRDGIRWEKPDLDVKPGTNIVLPGYRDSNTVWLDLEKKDPRHRFEMFRVVEAKGRDKQTGVNNWEMAIYFSPDGVHWREAGRSGRLVDRSTVFWNPFRKV